MIQKHNRNRSFSIYICVLAMTDTICLLIGEIIPTFHLVILIVFKIHTKFQPDKAQWDISIHAHKTVSFLH